MAATAHTDPYSVFLRKIGYSVGLEKTAERVEDLASRYLKDRDLTLASWHKLVASWDRKSTEKDFGNFFYSLRLIQRTYGDILVLENLDAIALSTEFLEKEEQHAARDFLLLWAILVNDGEIFINLLLADFEESQIKDTLRAMMLQKRAILLNCLSGKVTAERINRVITIERQEKNKGSAGGGQSVASLLRTEPLQPTRSFKPTADKGDNIQFSVDYFRKVPPRRKGWATSLGLWDAKVGITQRGCSFVEGLRKFGYITDQNYFIFWPMDHELIRSGFRPDLFGESTKNLWLCLVEFGFAYAGLTVKPASNYDADEGVNLIEDMMKTFRSLHARKSMLRRELPITIAYPAAVAIACAQAKPVLDLPAAICAEQKGGQRRVALRRSRNTGGALSVKR